MIPMPLKWHHIDKCNKNCKFFDILALILAHLSSSAPFGSIRLNEDTTQALGYPTFNKRLFITWKRHLDIYNDD
jgi:hypothetical protein